ncbi:hypothetical protein HDU99_008890, partial [Rhizoclosmatium hyalinum]
SLCIKEKVYGTRDHPDVAGTILELAQIASRDGDYVEAHNLFTESLNIQVKVYGTRNHPAIAEVLYTLGINFYRQGDYIAAKKLYLETLDFFENAKLSSEHPNVLAVKKSLDLLPSQTVALVSDTDVEVDTVVLEKVSVKQKGCSVM